MAQKDLVATATNCTDIRSIEVTESYSQFSANAVVECNSSSLSLSDAVTIIMGYTGDTATVFKGFAKKITRARPDNVFRIECNDVLVRAIDFFIAADDPENPFQRNNITSLNLIKDVLALAGITNVTNTEPGPAVLTWGTNEDGVRFNLQSVADAVKFITEMTGNLTYYDQDADLVEFKARKPYVEGGDSSSGTFTTGASGNIIDITYDKSTEKTRNVLKVYGKSPLNARARADNANLVVDQAAVIAHELLDSQSICDEVASINLEILNRLTETYTLSVEGDPSIRARQVRTLTESFVGASSLDIFLYAVQHIFTESGYVVSITAVP